MRAWIVPALALAAALLVVVSRVPALGLALRIAFVLASAAPICGVLLLATARLTGADWSAAEPASRPLVWFVPAGALAMLAATGVQLPPHLALWMVPPLVAARSALFVGALAYAGHRLRHHAGTTFAGITLALYAFTITPVAADWLLPTAPGHPVSAVGMMLFLLQFAAGCAAALPRAAPRARRDLALLLVAALLGLCYLAYMDYLIVWFGNLPGRVPFYLDRSGWLALAAILVGLVGTIVAVILGRIDAAVAAAAAGLTLFALWWIGGGLLAALVALVAVAALALLRRRETAHG